MRRVTLAWWVFSVAFLVALLVRHDEASWWSLVLAGFGAGLWTSDTVREYADLVGKRWLRRKANIDARALHEKIVYIALDRRLTPDEAAHLLVCAGLDSTSLREQGL